MGKKTAAVGLLALAAAGSWAFVNRDWLAAQLGLQEYSPARLRAIDLAKNAYTLDRYQTNYEVIERRMADPDAAESGGWTAERRAERRYLVRFEYVRDGTARAYAFDVDLVSAEVRAAGEDGAAAPR